MLESEKFRKTLEATFKKLVWQEKSMRYQKDPLLWLEERFGEDPNSILWSKNEGYDKHVFDGSKDPLYNAWMDLTNLHFVGLESATGTGKTYIASRIIYWFLDCFVNSLVVVIGPTTAQLKANMWAELSTAFPKFKNNRSQARILANELRVIDVPEQHGWHAIMRSGSGDSKSDEDQATAKLSGFHRQYMLFVIDEMQGVSKEVLETIENTCTGEHNLIIALGNPDSQQDTLHKFCMRKEIKNYIVSGLDHPNVVLDKEVIKGAVTRKSIARRKEKYGEDSPFFQSRVRGICPTYSSSDLFNLATFDKLCTTQVDFDQSANAVGIDPANSEDGDDACVVFGMRNYCVSINVFKCPDCNLIADNVIKSDIEILSKYGEKYLYNLPKIHDFRIKGSNIGIDSVGVGIGTVNAFNNHQIKAVSLSGGMDATRIPKDDKGKPLYEFGNLRTQMIWQLAYDINNELICFSSVNDLEALDNIRKAMRYVKLIVTGNKTFATPKEDIIRYIAKSPNEFDAVVYWNWIRNNKEKAQSNPEIYSLEQL